MKKKRIWALITALCLTCTVGFGMTGEQPVKVSAADSLSEIQQKQKEIQKSREALKTGDKVITAGGIYGKIKEIGDTYMLIEVADGVRIHVDKTSIFASAEDAQQQK